MAPSPAPASQTARPARRLAWLVPIVLAVAVLPACTTGLLYNRVDWAVSWYVDGLVGLDDTQERMLHDSVRRTMAWHRQTQLVRYVALLERMAAEAAAPFTAQALEAHYQEATVFLDDFLLQAAPDVARLLGSLDSRQLAELAASLDEDNAELWEDYGGETPELRQKRRVKAALRTIQRFVGGLSATQRRLVEARMAAMEDLSGQWLERRRNWQRELLRTLQFPDRGPAFEEGIRDLMVNPNQFDAAGYRRGVEANRRVIFQLLAELSATLSMQQRVKLRSKFQEFATDLRRLSAAG